MVLVARVPFGFEVEGHHAMVAAFEAARAEGWWFGNPATFEGFFVADRTAGERVAACERALDALRASPGPLSELTVTRREGQCVAHFDWRGRLKERPLGACGGAP